MNVISTGARGRPWAGVALSWAVLAVILIGLYAVGISPNGDADDVMKMQEIRHVLTGPSLFDRFIPGVAQPEPMQSHWPWIVDAPYALVAWLLRPLIGLDPALAVAAFAIPLALLGLVLAAQYRINAALGFAWPGAILLVSALLALTSYAEFQPGRIDYHNLQMLLLSASLLFTMLPGTRAAALGGVATAISLAISSEIAPFLLAPMAFLSVRFVLGREGAARELPAFGAALALAGLALFLAVTLPQHWALAACDRFAAPHLVALVGAGLTFALAGRFAAGAGPVLRLCLLGAGAALSGGLILTLFPGCLDGPYGQVSPYLRAVWLDQIEQERSLLAAPDALSGGRFGKLALAFLGAGAGAVWGWTQRRRSRVWLTLALYCGVGLVMSILAVRYLRFLPLLATPGLALLLLAAMPASFASRKWLQLPERVDRRALFALAGPAIVLIALVVALRALWPPVERELVGVDVASACSTGEFGLDDRLSGKRVLAPPLVAMGMLGKPVAPDVTAVPFHTVGPGLERVYRFFDPATTDPKIYLAGSKADYVVACRFDAPQAIVTRFPLAAALAGGKPPAWLAECDMKGGPLRLYRPVDAASACPDMR